MVFAAGDLERELCRIPDVFAARVTINGSGRATEARILATPERTTKRIKRDVRSVALASFGVELPPSAISITQLERAPAREERGTTEPGTGADPELPEPDAELEGDREAWEGRPGSDDQPEEQASVEDQGGGPAAGGEALAEDVPRDETPVSPPEERDEQEERYREAAGSPEGTSHPTEDATGAELVQVTVTASEARLAVTVELARGDAVSTRTAHGAASEAVSSRLAAEAALGALAELAPLPRDAGVAQAAILAMGTIRVAVVVATLSGPGAAQQVSSGSSVVTGSGEHPALARAALSAAAAWTA